MPLYDFECTRCEHKFEDVPLGIREFTEEMVLDCPNCGRERARFVFAGSQVDDWGQGRYYEHVCPGGKTFYSRAEKVRYFRQHGLRERDSFVD